MGDLLPYIKYALDNKIMQGKIMQGNPSEGTFRPNDPVTRQEAIKIVAKSFCKDQPDENKECERVNSLVTNNEKEKSKVCESLLSGIPNGSVFCTYGNLVIGGLMVLEATKSVTIAYIRNKYENSEFYMKGNMTRGEMAIHSCRLYYYSSQSDPTPEGATKFCSTLSTSKGESQ